MSHSFSFCFRHTHKYLLSLFFDDCRLLYDMSLDSDVDLLDSVDVTSHPRTSPRIDVVVLTSLTVDTSLRHEHRSIAIPS